MSIEQQDLFRAAKAIRAREARQKADEMSDEKLEEILRRSPLWATVLNAPGPNDPITNAHLHTFVLNHQIAKVLGIEI